MLRSIKLRVSDRLQAIKSGKVSISEPHERGGTPLFPPKNSSDLHKTLGWPWPRLGSPDPRPSPRPATPLPLANIPQPISPGQYPLGNIPLGQYPLRNKSLQTIYSRAISPCTSIPLYRPLSFYISPPTITNAYT